MTVSRSAWLTLLLTLPSSAFGTTQSAELADPDRPAELVFRVPYAILEVVGTNGDRVRMSFDEPEAGGASVHLPFAVQGNRVEVVHPGNTTLLDVRIEIPRRTDLTLETSNGGPVTVVGVDGVIEVANSNAGVKLEDVGGSIVVSTSNGPILAEIEHLYEGGVVSLVTSNGQIEVVLPHELQGHLLAESDTGPIESDFRVHPDPLIATPRPGRVLSGRIGTGDGRVRLLTNNAGIRIRRSNR